jgi:hypothetical protein
VAVPWLTIIAVAIAVAYWRSNESSPWVQRMSAGAGALSIAALAALGALWPSVHTIAALVALPAAGILIGRSFKPSLLRQSWSLVYTRVAVITAIS